MTLSEIHEALEGIKTTLVAPLPYAVCNRIAWTETDNLITAILESMDAQAPDVDKADQMLWDQILLADAQMAEMNDPRNKPKK